MAAILVFGIVVLVHEWGAFPRRPRVRRPGGGICHRLRPAVWKHTGKDDTLYSIRLLPLGGYKHDGRLHRPRRLEEDESGRIRVRPDAEAQPPIKKAQGAAVLPDAIDGKTYRKPRRGSDFLSLPAAR